MSELKEEMSASEQEMYNKILSSDSGDLEDSQVEASNEDTTEASEVSNEQESAKDEKSQDANIEADPDGSETELSATEGEDDVPEVDEFGDTEDDRQTAKIGGWAPKEKWKGDPKAWRPAHEFVERGKQRHDDLKGQIDQLKQSLQSQHEQLLNTVSEMSKHHKEDKKRAIEQALADLEYQRQEAILEGDPDQVALIEQQQDQKRSELPVDTEVIKDYKDNVPDIPNYNAWVERNSWYENDIAATVQADQIGERLMAKNNYGHDNPQFFSDVEKEMLKIRPDLFRAPEPEVNPRRGKAPSVGRSKKTTNTSSKPKFDRLPKQFKDDYLALKESFPDGSCPITPDQWAEKFQGEE